MKHSQTMSSLSLAEQNAVKALQKVTVLPGGWDKRFIRNLNPSASYTDTQKEWIIKLLEKYRKQIPDYSAQVEALQADYQARNLTLPKIKKQ